MQGCLPSHLIFLRRHSSQARVTRRRFWLGCDGALGSEGSISVSDLMPSAGDGASGSCQSLTDSGPASSSDISADMAAARNFGEAVADWIGRPCRGREGALVLALAGGRARATAFWPRRSYGGDSLDAGLRKRRCQRAVRSRAARGRCQREGEERPSTSKSRIASAARHRGRREKSAWEPVRRGGELSRSWDAKPGGGSAGPNCRGVLAILSAGRP